MECFDKYGEKELLFGLLISINLSSLTIMISILVMTFFMAMKTKNKPLCQMEPDLASDFEVEEEDLEYHGQSTSNLDSISKNQNHMEYYERLPLMQDKKEVHQSVEK